jgi:hypothetical protein
MFKDSSILSLIAISELTKETTGLGRQYPDHYWEFIAIGATIYLLLSLPLARVARSIEARLRSVTYVPRVDPIVAAGQILIASTVVGVIAGILADNFSRHTLVGGITQWIAAVGLTLLLMLVVLVVLGGIISLPGTLIGLFKRPKLPNQPDKSDGAPVAVAAQ